MHEVAFREGLKLLEIPRGMFCASFPALWSEPAYLRVILWPFPAC